MRIVLILTAALALLCPAVSPASAATAIFYSKPDNTYGWCAGYSYSKSESCARGGCEEYGGTDCQLAVECDGGWSAAAFAADPRSGFGAACNFGSAGGARSAALIACVTATGALCWTDAAFDGNGNETSERSNAGFDYAFYAQGLLNMAGYDAGNIDGQMGGRTRAAIRAFESDLGLPPRGEADDRLIGLLLYFVHGGKLVGESMQGALGRDMSEFLFSYAGDAVRSFSAELAALPDSERLTALAAAMTSAGTRCTLPAVSAELINGDIESEAWNVGCAEGEFTVLFAGSMTVISDGFSDSAPPPQNKSSPVILNEPNPNLSNG
jgi:peptidoglycan hydrolase-like protein with peptidoglycan-binding domain